MKDKTPEGNRQNASQQFSGEVFTEYGIVSLRSPFPSETKIWQPAEPFDADEEKYVVVPFRVVKRGFKTRRGARLEAERMEEEEGGEYKAVQMSDTRGL